ncbi:hypothetical protein HFO88_26375 [Rhizobium leguminosarum]|uniref:hypothetical protein n=1 Tax=Rhizobium leguminosarum TaxID=384 RepID=UPI001C964C3B|nr:hypothetical protein [Rhizobium leguminosarum]MBY5903847.1 hypothetical protein [Rhizobium leguminosarum]MBY5911056.1 hypothetical protein [Rhizobium leguminosarum]
MLISEKMSREREEEAILPLACTNAGDSSPKRADFPSHNRVTTTIATDWSQEEAARHFEVV